jgi:putative hydrolase of the HAD superfamily
MPLNTIFFDVGNTLLFQNHQRTLAALHERRWMPTREQLYAIERETKPRYDTLLVNHGKTDHGFWHIFYERLLETLGLEDGGVHQALVEATRLSANWDQCRRGTRELLERIAGRYRIGVISNADGKIAEVLERCGIADCFLTITDSGIVGHEKPAPEIFHAALRQLDARAEESLYVGDVYSVDYRGATRVGMQAILFDVSGAYRERGLPRVESLEELGTQLGC